MNNEKTLREPLFHISKRSYMPFRQRLVVKICSVIGAFAVASILSWIMLGVNPVKFVSAMFGGIFGSQKKFEFMLQALAVLLGISLALAPAFKMHFWNTGAEGQVLIGGLAAAMCMYYLGGVKGFPSFALYLCMFAAGIVAGAVWGCIPAIFKAFWNTNETLFTLMMNYVAMQLVAVFIDLWVKDGSKTLRNSKHLHSVRIPQLIKGNDYLLVVSVVALIAVGMYVYLRYSKHGYEISVVGESENTARYVGINVKKVVIRTMCLSGAICGIMGVLLVGALDGTIHATDTVKGQGFTGIIVCWLGGFNPFYMVLTAFLLVFIDKGMAGLNLVNDAFPSVISGLVVFIIIGAEFFIRYKLTANFAKDKKKRKTEDAEPTESQRTAIEGEGEKPSEPTEQDNGTEEKQ